MSDSELEQLTGVFRNLGAGETAAGVMAGQLLKRASQLSEEHSVSRAEALEYLLKMTIAGRQGRTFEGEPPWSGATMRDGRRKKG